MEKMQVAVKEFKESLRKIAEAIREMIVAAVKQFWDIIKGNLPVIQQIVIDYENAEKRIRHNQLTRSSWNIDWDSRRQSQVINKRPAFYTRKIIR